MRSPSGKAAPATAPEPSAPITSKDNRWLKRFRAALAGDRATGEAVGVEGVRLVEAALGSNLAVEALLVSESGQRHLARVAPILDSRVPVLRTSDKLFAGVAGTLSPQGIAALAKPREHTVEGLLSGLALVAVLVGVQDPGNVGTILRAGEALGASGVATCPAGGIGTADPLGPKALRASAGSALRLPLVHGIAPAILLTQLRISQIKIYAAVAAPGIEAGSSAPRASRVISPVVAPWEVDWKAPSALLIGNEGAGLPPEIESAADARVYIPQAAASVPVGLESMNAAMAATVLLYEAMRQRTLHAANKP